MSGGTIPACEYVPLDLSPQPIIGWRCWFVYPHEGLLRPIYRRGMVWKPRETMEATCPNDPHDPPDPDCKCGIWSTRELADLEEPRWRTNPPDGVDPLPGVLIVGQIALWGRCIEYERGWRASHAYPKHLYAFTDDAVLAATLRDRYLVPVEYGERAGGLETQLPENAADPDARTRRATQEAREALAAELAEVERARQAAAEQRRQIEAEMKALGDLRRQRDRQADMTVLRERLTAAGIQNRAVAIEAGVTPQLVSHVFAGRTRSANVVDAAERLLQRR